LGLTDWGIFSRKRQHRPAPHVHCPLVYGQVPYLKNGAGSQRVVATLEGAPYRVVKVDRNALAGSTVYQYAGLQRPAHHAAALP